MGTLFNRLLLFSERQAIATPQEICTYHGLVDLVASFGLLLEKQRVPRNAVVALIADFSPKAIAMLLALIERDCIIVPLTHATASKKNDFLELSEVEFVVRVDDEPLPFFSVTNRVVSHPLLSGLREANHAGLVLFSSGSSGKPKATVHDLVRLLEKFDTPRPAKRILSFLLFDHIGGFNTIFHCLANGGCIVTTPERTPQSVARAIEQFQVEVLPASPTFLNLFLMTEAYRGHDLTSLKVISYGTEPMAEGTLQRLHEVMPQVRLHQMYGMSEIGIMRSKSRSSNSVWLKIGGEGIETRVVDGLLEVKARSAMVGYLNAPSPFTEDGWLKTGDAVEVDGEYLRILGRKSEIINVGGVKVFPAEVEGLIRGMGGVEDVTVIGESHPITGQIVTARVKLSTPEDRASFRVRMMEHCRDRVAPYKIPQKIVLVTDPLYNDRFKKTRIEGFT